MKLVSIGVAVLVSLGTWLAVPHSASANHTTTCQSPATWRTFLGRTVDPVGSVTGVRADIDVGNWATCVGGTASDFLYYFVDVGSANSGCQLSSSCLIQFGIVRSPTSGTQYAWAYGGCNGAAANIRHLGSATTSSHNFRIERDALNVFRFFIDGGQLAISLSQNDPDVACWAGGDRGADWLMEKSDFGNAFGEVTAKSQFDSLGYKTSSWKSVAFTSTCYDGQWNDRCTDFDDGDFDGWTDNGGTFANLSTRDLVVEAPYAEWTGVPWR